MSTNASGEYLDKSNAHNGSILPQTSVGTVALLEAPGMEEVLGKLDDEGLGVIARCFDNYRSFLQGDAGEFRATFSLSDKLQKLQLAGLLHVLAYEPGVNVPKRSPIRNLIVDSITNPDGQSDRVDIADTEKSVLQAWVKHTREIDQDGVLRQTKLTCLLEGVRPTYTE